MEAHFFFHAPCTPYTLVSPSFYPVDNTVGDSRCFNASADSHDGCDVSENGSELHGVNVLWRCKRQVGNERKKEGKSQKRALAFYMLNQTTGLSVLLGLCHAGSRILSSSLFRFE